jgi:CubicO group peptidase (beta-lactamase class C family)
MSATRINRRLACAITLALLVVAICLTVVTASAAPAAAPAAALPAVSADHNSATHAIPADTLSDPAELAVFLDELLSRQLADNHIPGASVAVVTGDQLLFAQGYGYANLERHTPLVADQTLLRVGSIAKLFTWTAVLQLAEQGKLDLNADVNTYLGDVVIPATYPAPITLAHLLTHTAGFEDRQLGITVSRAAGLISLPEYVAAAMPERVFPAGSVTAYSNYGATLAGYIVEHVSGEPFVQYIQRHILAPLAMHHSTFAQQLPPELAMQLAVSYAYDGTHHAKPFEYFQIAPAGGLSATAVDIAQFMIAQLQEGRLGDARILQAATMQDMQRQHFSNDPHVNGMTYGFAEMTLNGQRLLVHPGTTNDEAFSSLLVLLPEHKAGLFVSYTGAGGDSAKWELLQALLDRYYPAPAPVAIDPPANFAQRAGQVTGSYRSTRMAFSTIEKIQALLAPPIMVSATNDGYLIVTGQSQEPTRWVELEPLVFRQVGSQETIAFRADAQSQVTYLFRGNLPINGYQKLAWFDTLPFHYGLLAACLLLFMSALVCLPIGWLLARRRSCPAPRLAGMARWLGWGVSALYILFPILFVVSISDLSLFPSLLMKAALAIALVATVVTIGVVACVWLAWQRRYWSVLGRSHYTLLALGALAFSWFLNYWNLFGFRW